MRVTIEQCDANHATLRTADDQTLTVPRNELPESACVGDTVDIHLTHGDTDHAQARAILDELLGNDPDA